MSNSSDYFRVDILTENGSIVHFHRYFPTEININKKCIDISWRGLIEPGHNYCVCKNSYEQTYLIDLTDKKLIGQRTYKS